MSDKPNECEARRDYETPSMYSIRGDGAFRVPYLALSEACQGKAAVSMVRTMEEVVELLETGATVGIEVEPNPYLHALYREAVFDRETRDPTEPRIIRGRNRRDGKKDQ